MTSEESKAGRLRRSQLSRAKALAGIDITDPGTPPPPGAVWADQRELVHNNAYGLLPRFYVDRVVVRRQCGTEEVWPAERQKWWYEVAKGNINTQAVLCRACRGQQRQRKEEARRVHMEGLKRKQSRDET
jgi:hypothetical protein